ncbi:MAG: hypothetical protein J6Y19_02120, partial [Kiritimatiellae bacterium]|nr:hypothetical protein [Kiritimatiellia bacterium]
VKFGTSSAGTDAHSAGVSTDHVDDPTTQFDLTWYAEDVGPDNPASAAWRTIPEDIRNASGAVARDLLSPWETYKVYYKEYDEVAADRHTGYNTSDEYIWSEVLESGTESLGGDGWKSVTKYTPIVDTSARADQAYEAQGMGTVQATGTQTLRLFDLDFDRNYVVVIVGVDKAGNEGGYGEYSWATNNTIKFALTQGVVRASTAINTALTGANLADIGMQTIDTTDANAPKQGAVLSWLAAGQDSKTGEFKHNVTKEYDLIFRDAGTFTENGTEHWALATSGEGANSGTSKTNWNYQAGDFTRLGRGNLRFFRASYRNRWQDAVTNGATVRKQMPLASDEVYAMNRVPLVEGKNLVALHGVPWTNTFAGVFGTDTSVLPAGNDITTATRVEFFDNALDQTRLDAAETYFFLKKQQGDSIVGEWRGATGVTTNEVNPARDANPHLEGWFVKSDEDYELSTDTNVVAEIAYYKQVGANTPVVPGTDANPSVERWYEYRYVPSSDTEVVASKMYYSQGESGYAKVTNPEAGANPKTAGWYECSFAMSSDTKVDTSKTYYSRTTKQENADVTNVEQVPGFFTRGFQIMIPDLTTSGFEGFQQRENPAGYNSNLPKTRGGNWQWGFDWYPILKVPTTNGMETASTASAGTASASPRSVSQDMFELKVYGGSFGTEGEGRRYTLVSLNLPVAVHPKDMKMDGWFEPGNGISTGDLIYTYDNETGSVRKDLGVVYRDADDGDKWKRRTAGMTTGTTNGLAKAFKPNDVIVIVSFGNSEGGKVSDRTWTYSPSDFYEHMPDRWMGRKQLQEQTQEQQEQEEQNP